MSEFTLSALPKILVELPAVRLAVVIAQGVSVGPSGAELEAEIVALTERLRGEISLEKLAAYEPIVAVRAMFRAWGIDPTHSRPSGEQLLCRVLQGKGLYRVSNVVDLNNLSSCETGWPWGSFDLDRVEPPLVFRAGRPDEAYLAIGKEMWPVEEKPVLCDGAGPFGGPIRDSQRTMITSETHRVLTVIFAPATTAPQALERAAASHAERLSSFTGASQTLLEIL